MIRWLIELGLLDIVATVYGVLCCVIALAFGIFLTRKMGIKWWRGLVSIAVSCLALMELNPLLFWIERGFEGELTGGSLTRSFTVLPLILLPLCLIIRLRADKGFDLVAVTFMLFQAFVHPACMFQGCCRGFPMASGGGVFNPFIEEYLFPVQLFDGITAFLIFLLMLTLLRWRKYDGRGIFYPILLIAHGLERLFWDFFRDTTRTYLNLTPVQFWAIGSIIMGAVWLSILKRREISAWFSEIKKRIAGKKAENAQPPRHHKKKKKKKR